ncbi:MAG TPA: TetR/AcrR family transcriptional regulator [Trebonia sp.]
MEAGVALLAEGGWPAVTTRAVAGRAGANVALIHYHFGGLPGLHEAIAHRAAGEVLTPIVDVLVAAAGPADALETLHRLLPATTGNDRVLRLVVELVAGAGRDPALGQALQGALRRARVRLAERLGELYPHWPPERRAGAATVALALLDGLMLHYLLDRELPASEALAALGALTAGTS